MPRFLQLHRWLAVAAAICAISAPAAGAAQDLRSPDSRDAATARADHEPRDLRSPDSRDAAAGYASSFGGRTTVSPVATPAPTPEPVSSNHDHPLPWLLGAGLALVGCAAAIRHSARRRQRVAA